jgi:hypothetical protein
MGAERGIPARTTAGSAKNILVISVGSGIYLSTEETEEEAFVQLLDFAIFLL